LNCRADGVPSGRASPDSAPGAGVRDCGRCRLPTGCLRRRGRGRKRVDDHDGPDGDANGSDALADRRDGGCSADGDAPRANDGNPDETDDDHGSTPTAAATTTTTAASASAATTHRDDDGDPDVRDPAGRSHHDGRRAPATRTNHDERAVLLRQLDALGLDRPRRRRGGGSGPRTRALEAATHERCLVGVSDG
jgi:hypothetical protein